MWVHTCVCCTNAGSVLCVCYKCACTGMLHIYAGMCVYACVLYMGIGVHCVYTCASMCCVYICVYMDVLCVPVCYTCVTCMCCVYVYVYMCLTIFFFKMAVLWWKPFPLGTTVLGTNTWVKLPYVCPRRLTGGCAQIHSTPKWGDARGTNKHSQHPKS